ncbi:MAG: hypothetical protein GX564_09645, partial [Oligosphaeraceae bacterium]|nr:hypothetical protein [Oligosphaeraceae bacterium]
MMQKVLCLCALFSLLIGNVVLTAQNSNGAPAAAQKTVQVDLDALIQMTPEQLQAYLNALEGVDLIEILKVIHNSNNATSPTNAELSTRVVAVMQQVVAVMQQKVNSMDPPAANAFVAQLQAAIPGTTISSGGPNGIQINLP